MKNRTRVVLAMAASLVVCMWSVAGPEWIENDNVTGTEDAGSTPDTSQPTTGNGDVDHIAGRLSTGPLLAGAADYQDVYAIYIAEPGTFYASTTNALGGFADFDSRLFLFEASGLGLLGNDDASLDAPGGPSTIGNLSTDGSGVVVSQPGVYYLAITVSPFEPVGIDGPIFEFGPPPAAASGSGSGQRGAGALDPGSVAPPESGQCAGDAANLLYPLDGSFTLVDFFGDGPTGSDPAQGPDQHNDDDSATVELPFDFDFYGHAYDTVYVNNNGNVTLDGPLDSFLPMGFPDDAIPAMLAAFWADVDTGSTGNPVGDVWMKLLDGNGDAQVDTLVVTWANVGYYDENADRLNTFQLAISDGTNPLIGIGLNVAFSYDEMCWTTGDASGGAGGFGGTPATVGVNRGDGDDFFQVGLFDHAGADFDGAGGATDGVDYLDGRQFAFSTAGSSSNVPPIPVGVPEGNTIMLEPSAGEVLDLDLQFLSPEMFQTTTVSVADLDGAQAAGLAITITPGNVAEVALEWMPGCEDVGTWTLLFTATDDFNPAGGVTVVPLTIVIACPEVSGPDGPGGDGPIVGWSDVEPGPLNSGEYIISLSGVSFAQGVLTLDVKPGGCENPLNRGSNGVTPVAIAVPQNFDVDDIDLSSIAMHRADGVGGAVAPHEGPPGPHTTIEDVASPGTGITCVCQALEGDGFPDVSMHFDTQGLVAALELDALPGGALVELVVDGVLLDGTPFSTSDCVRLVPPGAAPALLIVQSRDVSDAWVDASPLDTALDGGGFVTFARGYPAGTVVTLDAPQTYRGQPFAGWAFAGAGGPLVRSPSITFEIGAEVLVVEPVFGGGTADDGIGPAGASGGPDPATLSPR